MARKHKGVTERDLELLQVAMRLRGTEPGARKADRLLIWKAGELGGLCLALLGEGAKIEDMDPRTARLLAELGVTLVDDRPAGSVNATALRDMLEMPGEGTLILTRPDRTAVISELHLIPAGSQCAPQRLLVLRDPASGWRPSREILRDIFGLTNAESAFAHAMIAHASLNRYAKSRGLKRSYVDTLAKRVMAKCSVSTRPELIQKLICVEVNHL